MRGYIVERQMVGLKKDCEEQRTVVIYESLESFVNRVNEVASNKDIVSISYSGDLNTAIVHEFE